MNDVPEIGDAEIRALFVQGCTGPQGQHDVGLGRSRPNTSTLPQGKVDRIVVFQFAILEGAKGGQVGGLEKPKMNQRQEFMSRRRGLTLVRLRWLVL